MFSKLSVVVTSVLIPLGNPPPPVTTPTSPQCCDSVQSSSSSAVSAVAAASALTSVAQCAHRLGLLAHYSGREQLVNGSTTVVATPPEGVGYLIAINCIPITA
ncbi:hypothetical protein B0H13DRAFT_2309035 [Mycena leptocephala]|nr:hypothetical protein B0H13DRAFT_2309035 [Mycena leptocephala]